MSFGGNQQVPTRLENFSFNKLAMTPTPAACQVLTMFAYCFRMPRLNVRVYETGMHSAYHSGTHGRALVQGSLRESQHAMRD